MSRSIGSFPERARYVLRYIYPGSTPRNGRVIDLGELDGPSAAALPIEATMIADGVDPARWSVRVFDNFLEGWRALGDGATTACWLSVQDGAFLRCELSLDAKTQPEASTSDADEGMETCVAPPVGEQSGFFGIGIYNGKNINNLGTLWRSAYQLGAAFTFVVGSRFRRECSDTPRSWTQIPCFEYKDWNDFVIHSPVAAVWVGVEMGGTPLENFEHPPKAVYVLGSEDTGLNTTMLRACRHHIALPTTGERLPSFNVAVTGALIMYDREVKRRRAAAAAARPARNRREGIDSVKPAKGPPRS